MRRFGESLIALATISAILEIVIVLLVTVPFANALFCEHLQEKLPNFCSLGQKEIGKVTAQTIESSLQQIPPQAYVSYWEGVIRAQGSTRPEGSNIFQRIVKALRSENVVVHATVRVPLYIPLYKAKASCWGKTCTIYLPKIAFGDPAIIEYNAEYPEGFLNLLDENPQRKAILVRKLHQKIVQEALAQAKRDATARNTAVCKAAQNLADMLKKFTNVSVSVLWQDNVQCKEY